tara:strand:- start:1508 stop:2344 length:837 start_codon:yes stop_codon:yes gene_type:complete
MSIKQNGGVFGRNPTFNDVTIEGQLTFDGDIDINSDLKVDGNLEVTGNTSTDKITATGTYQNPLAVFNSTSGYGRIVFQENGTPRQWLQTLNGADGLKLMNGDGTTEVMRSQSNNISIANGNLVIGTSGKGIDFSATAGTGTSELLSDYEEGVWTPVLRGASTAGTPSVGTLVGSYVKIGKLVTLTLRISNLTLSGAVGSIQITGIPFTAATASSNYGTASFSMTNNITFDGSKNQNWYMGSSSMLGMESAGGGGWADLAVTNASGMYINQTITYEEA